MNKTVYMVMTDHRDDLVYIAKDRDKLKEGNYVQFIPKWFFDIAFPTLELENGVVYKYTAEEANHPIFISKTEQQ